MEKDLQLMLDLGRELEVPLPHTALSQQSLRSAIAKGYGDDDICGSIRVLEELAGVEVGQTATTASR
jgi:3-hydroxyisobutyrate dehydrogenase-like beta-hydroxyacid dehydrogenase